MLEETPLVPSTTTINDMNTFRVPPPKVHLDYYVHITGRSRFLEIYDKTWSYNHTDGLTDSDKLAFTHLITEKKYVPGFVPYKEPIQGYNGVDLKNMRVKFANTVYMLQREDMWELYKSKGKDSGCSFKQDASSQKTPYSMPN